MHCGEELQRKRAFSIPLSVGCGQTGLILSIVNPLPGPYDIYMKTLYTLVKDRLEDEGAKDILWDDEITARLADFQKVAVRQAVQMIRDYGGTFVADVVGLGKSYIGAAIVKHFERTDHARPRQ
jgi:hypothetical protein